MAFFSRTFYNHIFHEAEALDKFQGIIEFNSNFVTADTIPNYRHVLYTFQPQNRGFFLVYLYHESIEET